MLCTLLSWPVARHECFAVADKGWQVEGRSASGYVTVKQVPAEADEEEEEKYFLSKISRTGSEYRQYALLTCSSPNSS